jgi:hypothetical protein
MTEENKAEKEETTINQSKLNGGLAAIHQDMVDAIKEQTAAAVAGEIAAQKRHDDEMAKKQGLKEQNVWLQGCTAALCNDNVGVEVAVDCADKVLAGFKERFGS